MTMKKRCDCFGLLLLYLLALLQPPLEEYPVSRASDRCSEQVCGETAFVIAAGVPALSVSLQNRVGDPTRSASKLLEQYRFSADVPQGCSARNSAVRASCVASILKYRAVLHLIRTTRTGFRACAPRSPPLLV